MGKREGERERESRERKRYIEKESEIGTVVISQNVERSLPT